MNHLTPPSFTHSMRIISVVMLIAVLLITACTPQKRVSRSPIEESALQQQSATALLSQARAYDYPDAATLLFAAIARAETEKRADLIGEAIVALDKLPLNGVDQYRRQLAGIQRIHVAEGTKKAIEAMGRLGPPPDNVSRIHGATLKAELLEASQQLYPAARERMYALPLLSGDQRTATARKLWGNLETVPLSTFNRLAGSSLDPREGVWVELALIMFGPGGAGEQIRRIGDWQKRYRNFVIASDLPDEVRSLPQQAANQPGSVALMLPLTGDLAEAGEAIRDGFLAAMLAANAGASLQVVLIDSNQGIENAYREAQVAGADLVVGPLDKAQVAQLNSSSNLSLPTLSLNYLPTGTRANEKLYQFGLAPEDEALVAVQQAYEGGKRNLVLVQSNNDWSARASDVVVQQWRSLGGVIMAHLKLGRLSDLNNALAQVDKIVDSETRAAALATALGLSRGFHLQQRQQVDAVILLVGRNEARALAPQLRGYFGSHATQYGISPILGDRDVTRIGRELDGILVVDTPWRLGIGDSLHVELAGFWPGAHASTANLYALGADAFQLHSRLAFMESSQQRIRGASGQLTMHNRRILRTPALARIENGVAAPYQ